MSGFENLDPMDSAIHPLNERNFLLWTTDLTDPFGSEISITYDGLNAAIDKKHF